VRKRRRHVLAKKGRMVVFVGVKAVTIFVIILFMSGYDYLMVRQSVN